MKNLFSLTISFNWWELFIQSSRLNEMFENDRLGHGNNNMPIESHRDGVQKKHLVYLIISQQL